MIAAQPSIRAVADGDRSQWAELWEGYNRFYERAVAPDVTALTWSRFLDATEPMHALVAERDGHLVGLVHYLFHRSTTLVGPTCYLQDLFTAEPARGQGVGRTLIAAVCERAQAAGASRVYWQTHETNLTARKLYEQVALQTGFIIYRADL